MAASITTIKNWFLTNLKPTQEQFWATWDSFWHKDEQIPQNKIDGLPQALNAKADSVQFNGHLTDPAAHADLFANKADIAALNGLTLEVDHTTASLNLKSVDGEILATVNLGFLNNEGTTLFYNTDTGNLELKNDEEEVLTEIPVSSLISNTIQTVAFNVSTPHTLEFKNNQGTIVGSASFNIVNINGLQAALDNKVNKAGDETIDGVKTFSSSPVIPNATQDNHPVSRAQSNLKLNKGANTEFESPADANEIHGFALLSKIGAIFRSVSLIWDENLKKLTIKGSQAIWEAWNEVTDGNMGIKTLSNAVSAFKLFDNIGDFLSVGTEGDKRMVRVNTRLRLYNGVAYNSTEFKAVECEPSVTTLIKAIEIPNNTTVTIDVVNLSVCNIDNNALSGSAKFIFKNVAGVVTDLTPDSFKYNDQHSTIKAVPGIVTNTDTRVDATVSGTNANINFVNTVAKLTNVNCEIKNTVTTKPTL